MANNRLWLVHRPTGKSVMLGKRMAVGWYTNREDAEFGARMREFFDEIPDDMNLQDDFILAIEDSVDAPCCTSDFVYEDGRPKLSRKVKT